MNKRVLILARLLFGVSVALTAFPPAAAASDAVRTATAMAVLVRLNDSLENRRAIPVGDDMRDSLAPLPAPAAARSPAPRLQERLGRALARTMAPWKTLLGTAWDGMKSWSS